MLHHHCTISLLQSNGQHLQLCYPRQLRIEVVQQTTKTTSYIFALFVGATAFSLVLRGLGGDEVIESALTGLPRP
jgi:TRAP-type mannitol/chloroaromatic compound transport system permease large subunit